MSAEEVCGRLLDPEHPCSGITISGGEPFLQAEALISLIRTIKTRRDIGVIVYSGFTLDELERDDEKSSLLSEIDVLIDGRYIKELDDGRAYVGSSTKSYTIFPHDIQTSARISMLQAKDEQR